MNLLKVSHETELERINERTENWHRKHIFPLILWTGVYQRMENNFARRLSFYAIGPSSTGKTTFCTSLSKRLGLAKSAYVTEVARQVMKEKGYSRNTISSVKMQQDIMDAHYAREDSLDAVYCPIRVCDRSAIDPIVYAILTSLDANEANERRIFLTQTVGFRKALERYKAKESIVLLFNPVPAWLVDDGVRSTENQQECVLIFKKLLKEFDIGYYQVGEEMMYLEERVNFAIGLGMF